MWQVGSVYRLKEQCGVTWNPERKKYALSQVPEFLTPGGSAAQYVKDGWVMKSGDHFMVLEVRHVDRAPSSSMPHFEVRIAGPGGQPITIRTGTHGRGSPRLYAELVQSL